jgi:hypothetical protein
LRNGLGENKKNYCIWGEPETIATSRIPHEQIVKRESNLGVGIFPQGEKIVVYRAGLSGAACRRLKMIPLFLDKNLSHVYTFSQRYYVFSPLRQPFAGVFCFLGRFST